MPEELHGQRSLAGYSPWGCKELDMTEQLSLTHSSSLPRACLVAQAKNPPARAEDIRDMGLIPGSGRSPRGGNPPQDSCLENSMDRGALWAIVHGVAQS